MKAEKYFRKMLKNEEMKKLKEEEIRRATSEKLFYQQIKEKNMEMVDKI